MPRTEKETGTPTDRVSILEQERLARLADLVASEPPAEFNPQYTGQYAPTYAEDARTEDARQRAGADYASWAAETISPGPEAPATDSRTRGTISDSAVVNWTGRNFITMFTTLSRNPEGKKVWTSDRYELTPEGHLRQVTDMLTIDESRRSTPEDQQITSYNPAEVNDYAATAVTSRVSILGQSGLQALRDRFDALPPMELEAFTGGFARNVPLTEDPSRT